MKIFTILIACSLIISTHAYCTNDDDCKHNGHCQNHECKCEVARYAGSHCQYFLEDYLGTPYLVYFYIVTVVSVVLWIASSVQTFLKHQERKNLSMLHIASWFITIAMFLRVISYFLVVDGEWGRDDKLEPFSGLCFFLFYPLMLGSYLCMLFLWIELYTATTTMTIENLPRYRKFFIVLNGFMFPFEIVARTLTAVYYDTPIAYAILTIYFLYIGLACLLEAGGFIIVAGLVLRRLSHNRSLTATEQARRTFFKISGIMIACSVLLLIVMVIVALYLGTDTPESYFVILWLSRIVEYAVVCVLLYVYHVPRHTASSSSTRTEMELKKSTSSYTASV